MTKRLYTCNEVPIDHAALVSLRQAGHFEFGINREIRRLSSEYRNYLIS